MEMWPCSLAANGNTTSMGNNPISTQRVTLRSAPLLNKKLRRGLKAVFETRVRRKVFRLQSGESEIELSIDKGQVEAGPEILSAVRG